MVSMAPQFTPFKSTLTKTISWHHTSNEQAHSFELYKYIEEFINCIKRLQSSCMQYASIKQKNNTKHSTELDNIQQKLKST